VATLADRSKNPDMKAGFAERDITPDLPADRPEGIGYGFPLAQGIHDRCKVRAAVFDDGTCRVALVSCDVESMLRSVVQNARADIQAACGIPPECVLICGSHSHHAGFASIVEPGLFDHASDLVKHLAYDLSCCPSPRYVNFVRRQILCAVVAADRNKTDAVYCVGSGHENSVSFNRRFHMKNGRTYTHPGKGNPNIVEPAGPIDPEVGVIGAWDMQGRFLGCIVNFGCHATTNPGGLSADWIYYLEQTVRGVMGKDATVVFLTGACGDVTQIDNLSLNPIEIGESAARRVGQCVGAEVLKVLVKAQPGELLPIAAKQEVLRIRRLVPNPERVKRSIEIARQDPAKCDRTEWNFAKKLVLLDALVAKEPVADVEIQAIQIGPAVFLANPAEFFAQSGLDVKAASPFPFTFVVEMANGCVGYTPPEEEFTEHGGGFETRLTEYRNLEPTACRQITESSLRLARGLTPGKAPEPKKVSPVSRARPWGTAPPELE